mmetsp:Transcript_24769/g.41895  ORF Transcript_24769/g.41895 Transcript_24769/m.41895 type:complete len:292 (+) Transcript_24769:47-922(+)|eukprot:CAMPEP_0114412524 /NCGR_PEP_ID=MMETSP0103-20121206/373_1 /TAXON_ID=37642 ORGANISM="Paraphysomonas imperforata, Strain PA2" /NCGR_SAMPLE_ID=MMETSP0103 /ASSEMBLY_ACC=CAM_ASM_000201 /LENGTH=291 /DNA_ID=CAMNT_0001580549 /DNA_START=43 /DNA_END=918 /DNA_ORIENTATION=+
MREAKSEKSPLIQPDHRTSKGNSYRSAREAFDNVDPEISRQIHDSRNPDTMAEECHQEGGGYLKAIVFGGLDGILTIFAIVAGAYGGGLSWEVILILGLSNVFADAIAMGAGEYLSSKAHRDYVLTEKRREQWEYKNYKEGEIQEMIVLFNQRGMGLSDSEIVVKKMAEYEDFFIDLMVTEELGLTLPDEDEASLLKDAFAMFVSFLLFGTFPLVPFFLGPFDIVSLDHLIIAAFLCTAISLFCLGAFKSTFSSSTHWLSSGLESLCLGSVCAAIAYTIGAAVDECVQTMS